MTVICPADYNQTKQATIAIAQHEGPVYLRFGRPKWPVFIPEDMPFEIGKAQVLVEGSDISIFAYGHMVWLALEAEKQLQLKGIKAEVINVHTIKPLDENTILNSLRKTGKAVVAEEHNVWGGLGETIARLAAEKQPSKMDFVAVADKFGESGTPNQLLQKYGLTSDAIVQKSLQLI
jgi:transketolase